jgi:hypothetical protein
MILSCEYVRLDPEEEFDLLDQFDLILQISLPDL